MSSFEVSDLIEKVFELANNDAGWAELPNYITELYPEGRVAMVKTHLGRHLEVIGATAGYDIDYLQSYDKHYQFLNPWSELHRVSRLNATLYTTRDADVQPLQKALMNSEFYNDWLLPQDNIKEGAAIALANVGGSHFALTVNLPDRLAKYQLDPLIEDLRSLAKPLSLAMRVRSLFAEKEVLRTENDFLVETFKASLFIVDINQRVVHANLAAKRLLDGRDGMRILPNGTLEITDPASHKEFGIALAQTFEKNGGGWFKIARENGRKPLSATLVKISGSAIDALGATKSRCLLFVSDPWFAEHSVLPEKVSHLLGLTRSEAKVAVQLLDCEGTHEIAARLGLSRNTVRNQMSSILNKTGLTRQSSIAALITRISTQVGTDTLNK
jgi:DNA-binding CsgD family transcriptional regulator